MAPGAYVSARRRIQSRADQLRLAQDRVRELVLSLRRDGLLEDEIVRIFEAEFARVALRRRTS